MDDVTHKKLRRKISAKKTLGRLVDVVVLCIVLAAVWGVFSVPSVFFFTGRKKISVPSALDNSTCSPQNYTGNVCYDALSSRQQCIPGMRNSTDILIKSELLLGLSQESLENVLVGGFPSRPHNQAECDEIIRTLICLHVFTPCGEDGQLHAPSLEECTAVRNIQCAQEWADIEALAPNQASPLPTCETLPPISTSLLCPGNFSGSSALHPIITPMNITSTISDLPSSPPNLNCSANFYFDNYCKPTCGMWKPFPDAVVTANAVMVISASAIGIIVGAFVIAVSVLKYRHMFKFPSILILYESGNIVIFLLTILIGYMDTESLLCPSRDYTESLTAFTGYCVVFGIGLYYFLLQGEIFWVSHVAVVLWQIAFPLQSKYTQVSGRFHIVHVCVLIFAVVLPIGHLVAAFATGGYRPFFYPTTCVAQNADALFYSVVLPTCVFTATGVSLLSILFWVLIRRRWRELLVNLSVGYSKEKVIKTDSNSIIPTTALIKVSINFLCYTAISFLAVFGVASVLRVQEQYTVQLTEYFLCESTGISPGKVCERSFESLYNPLPTTVAIFLAGALFPIVNLLYVVNLKEFWLSLMQCFKGPKRAHPLSANHNNIM